MVHFIFSFTCSTIKAFKMYLVVGQLRAPWVQVRGRGSTQLLGRLPMWLVEEECRGTGPLAAGSGAKDSTVLSPLERRLSSLCKHSFKCSPYVQSLPSQSVAPSSYSLESLEPTFLAGDAYPGSSQLGAFSPGRLPGGGDTWAWEGSDQGVSWGGLAGGRLRFPGDRSCRGAPGSLTHTKCHSSYHLPSTTHHPCISASNYLPLWKMQPA